MHPALQVEEIKRTSKRVQRSPKDAVIHLLGSRVTIYFLLRWHICANAVFSLTIKMFLMNLYVFIWCSITEERKKAEVNKSEKIQSNMVYIINLVHQFCFSFIFGEKRVFVYYNRETKSKYLTVDTILYLGIWCGSDT